MSEKKPSEEETEPEEALEDQLHRLQLIFDNRVLKIREESQKEENMAKKKKKKTVPLPKKKNITPAEESPRKIEPVSSEETSSSHLKENAPPQDEEVETTEVAAPYNFPEEIQEEPLLKHQPEEETEETEPSQSEDASPLLTVVPDPIEAISETASEKETPEETTMEVKASYLKAVLDENETLRNLLSENQRIMKENIALQEEADKEFKEMKEQRRKQEDLLQALMAENKTLRHALFEGVQQKVFEILQVFKSPGVKAIIEEK